MSPVDIIGRPHRQRQRLEGPVAGRGRRVRRFHVLRLPPIVRNAEPGLGSVGVGGGSAICELAGKLEIARFVEGVAEEGGALGPLVGFGARNEDLIPFVFAKKGTREGCV